MSIDVGRVGIWTFCYLWGDAEGVNPKYVDLVAEFEDLGYRALWLGRADGAAKLVNGLLAATARLVVGTSIVNIWINPPEAVAVDYADVASRYPDRLLVGLGVSHAQFVEPTGQQYRRPLEKMNRYLDALDATTPTVPPTGRALAALGPRMLELSARRSAGALPYLTTPEHTRRAREILGPQALLIAEQKVVLDRDPISARAMARAGIHRYLDRPNYAANLGRLGYTDDDRADGGSDRLVDALVAWGDEEVIRARVAEHLAAGANHVAVQIMTEGFIAERDLPYQEWRELAPALVTL